ncbi:Helicase associated domain protein [Alphaproteobacteria bacterium]|nr:Helicase associated domain protein [Alphaproteobacteria bacterium]
MNNFEKLLVEINKDKSGKSFEIFCKWFLENDPYWKTQVEKVWFWDDWPERWGVDKGIDIVFEHKNGTNWAVQCKNYHKEYYIKKEDIDSFLSESNRKNIHHRLLIGTTNKIGKNAIDTMKGQEKPIKSFLLSDLLNSKLDYPNSTKKLTSNITKKKINTIRPYQQEAIQKVIKGFETHNRGKLIMACGTGKTLVTLWIKEILEAKTTLIFLPSLNLLSQTLFEWTSNSKEDFEVLCICSDSTVGKYDRDEDISITDCHFDVANEVSIISEFLASEKNKVIFCTYQSSYLLSEAQTQQYIDLVIYDEAHRCTGIAKGAYTKVLEDKYIKAKKRLFTTATPKVFPLSVKTIVGKENKEIFSMDDEKIYGPDFFMYSFGQAISDEWLTDYQVAIVAVDKLSVKQSIDKRELIAINDNKINDAGTLASQISLAKAIKKYDIKRIITFHNRIKDAQKFSNDFEEILDLLAFNDKPAGKIWIDFISGKMNTKERRVKLLELKNLFFADIGIISNARCLSEGVDVPTLDGVAFIDPKGSQIDIIQSVGRALRKSINKKKGTIILPIFVQQGDNDQTSIEKSNFKAIWNVLKAMRSHDNLLGEELDSLRQKLGEKKFTPSTNMPKKIIFDFPASMDSSFIEALKLTLLENTTHTWIFFYGLLKNYIEQNNEICSFDYVSEDEYTLGRWVVNQRYQYNKNKLSKERIELLEKLPFWEWDLRNEKWNIGYENLKKYIATHNEICNSRYITNNNYKLGSWLHTQRSRFKLKTLSEEQIKMLEALPHWEWESLNSQWKEGFQYLKTYIEKNNKVCEARYITKNGFKLGTWVTIQKREYQKNNITKDRVKLLSSLSGWTWNKYSDDWNECYSLLKEYIENHKEVCTQYYITENGLKLGRWTRIQRNSYSQNKLSNDRIKLLESLPEWTWSVQEKQWQESYEKLKVYIQKYNQACPQKYITEDGFTLGKWVNKQRDKYKKNTLSKDKILLLENLSYWTWSVRNKKALLETKKHI